MQSPYFYLNSEKQVISFTLSLCYSPSLPSPPHHSLFPTLSPPLTHSLHLHSTSLHQLDDPGTNSSTSLNAKESRENRMVMKRILVKCADVSNPCRPVTLCRKWAEKVAQEYFSQVCICVCYSCCCVVVYDCSCCDAVYGCSCCDLVYDCSCCVPTIPDSQG